MGADRGTNLFTDNEGSRWLSARRHMARIIALLGPPRLDLLERWGASQETGDYFDTKTGEYKFQRTSQCTQPRQIPNNP